MKKTAILSDEILIDLLNGDEDAFVVVKSVFGKIKIDSIKDVVRLEEINSTEFVLSGKNK